MKELKRELKKIEKQRADLDYRAETVTQEINKNIYNEWKDKGNLEKLKKIQENAEINNPEDVWKCANAYINDSNDIIVVTEHMVSSLFKNREELDAVLDIGREEEEEIFFDIEPIEEMDEFLCFRISFVDWDDPCNVIISENNGFTYEEFKAYVDKADKNTGGAYTVFTAGSDSNWMRLGDKDDVKNELERLKLEAKEA